MKKMITIVSLILSIFAVSSCSRFSLSSDSSFEDQLTGPLIEGLYGFKTHAELEDFYKIFKIKNSEIFIIPNFDDHENASYYFVSSGVHAHIIHEKIYDYDFPGPSFEICTNDYKIVLDDVSLFFDTLKVIDEINIIQNEHELNELKICAGENMIGTLTKSDVVLSENEFTIISNKFKEELKNVY